MSNDIRGPKVRHSIPSDFARPMNGARQRSAKVSYTFDPSDYARLRKGADAAGLWFPETAELAVNGDGSQERYDLTTSDPQMIAFLLKEIVATTPAAASSVPAEHFEDRGDFADEPRSDIEALIAPFVVSTSPAKVPQASYGQMEQYFGITAAQYAQHIGMTVQLSGLTSTDPLGARLTVKGSHEQLRKFEEMTGLRQAQ